MGALGDDRRRRIDILVIHEWMDAGVAWHVFLFGAVVASATPTDVAAAYLIVTVVTCFVASLFFLLFFLTIALPPILLFRVVL